MFGSIGLPEIVVIVVIVFIVIVALRRARFL